MYFQVSPVRNFKPKPTKPVRHEEDEVSTLTLAPFNPTPKLCFHDALICSTHQTKLLITNPRPNSVNVDAFFDGPAELDFTISWCTKSIAGGSSGLLDLFWHPSNEYSARHSLRITCGKQSWSIPIDFKSIAPKKPKQKEKKKITTTLVKRKSPLHKSSPTRKITQKSSAATFKKQHVWNDTPYLDSNKNRNKENINVNNSDVFVSPSNISFNLHTTEDVRRYTYAVSKAPQATKKRQSPSFDDSLELQSPVPSPNKQRSALRQIQQTNTPTLEELLHPNMNYQSLSGTPVGAMFRPHQASTELQKKSEHRNNAIEHFNSARSLSYQGMCPQVNFSNEEIGNLCLDSSRKDLHSNTFTKPNISSETYTKDEESFDLSQDKCLRDFGGNNTLSPICVRSNCVKQDPGLPLIVIEEVGSDLEQAESIRNVRIKRKSDCTFTCTPLKKQNLTLQTWSKSKVCTSAKRCTQISALKLKHNDATPGKGKVAKVINFHETKIFRINDPFILAATLAVDPFLTNTIYLDLAWIQQQEERFKRWFNMLLSPPSELNVADEGLNIDAARIWRECSKKEIAAAPTREVVCNNYHMGSKLNVLRKSASNLYVSCEIQLVLVKIKSAIDAGRLEIRQDRHIHLDLSLQSAIMSLVLSYNPLWLRIGLETVYKENISLTSNSDILGLSKFLYNRFFKNPQLFKKHKTIHSPKYTLDIKKFILTKYLELVYFLDNAKIQMLIPHNPCLFRKNSQVKESREMLIQFSLNAITAGVGDINKYLKFFGYTVHHKQLYIHEFDYAVHNLGGDLRDGVRLTRVMELILLKKDLTENLRVPAISRLQKIHNVNLVFKSLSDAGYEIQHDIEPYHIVDGHREKTLSFLWQIIYKFQAPLMIKTVKNIQCWWRSFPICLKRNKLRKIHNTKVEAAVKLQKWYRRQVLSKKLLTWSSLLLEYRRKIQLDRAAVKIQSYLKMYIQRKKFVFIKTSVINLQRQCRSWLQSVCYQRKINAAVVIQKNIRRFLARSKFMRLKKAVLTIEQIYKAKRLMLANKERYESVKCATVLIQTWFRATITMKKIRNDYVKLKTATCFVQQTYRNQQLTKKISNEYKTLKSSTIIIQRWYRSVKIMQKESNDYLQMKHSVKRIEKYYIAYKEMTEARKNYQLLRDSTISIQRRFRANFQMKQQRQYYIDLKKSVDFVQTTYRANKLMVNARADFQTLKTTTLFVQRIFRANKVMKIQRSHYLKQRNAALKIQRYFRGYLLMVTARKNYIQMKLSATLIQQKYRAKKTMTTARTCFQELKKAAIFIQRKFRANKAMKIQRCRYLEQRNASMRIQRYFRGYIMMITARKYYTQLKLSASIIQQRYRAKKSMLTARKSFLNLKKAAIFVQRKFRANKAMKILRCRYLEQRNASMKIQRCFRGYIMMVTARKYYVELKLSASIIQQRYRAKKSMLTARKSFLNLKKAAIFVQRKFRANKAMKIQRCLYLKQRNAAMKIQAYFRGYITMVKARKYYVELKFSASIIQQRYRAKKSMLTARKSFQDLKKAAMFIQRRFRANKAMQIQRCEYLEQRNAAIKIQRYFRGYIMMETDRKYYIQWKLSLQKAAIFVQRSFRANKAMKIQRCLYLQQRNATIIIQRHVRGYLMMVTAGKYYIQMKLSATFIQQKYRARKSMLTARESYQELKNAAIFIQRIFRANKAVKIQRCLYLKQRNAAITIQRQVRGYLMMLTARKRYMEMKLSAVYIQQKYRARKSMLTARKSFQDLRSAVIFVQRKYRAKKMMQMDRDDFLRKRKAAITIQKYFIGYLEMKKLRKDFLELKSAVAFVQENYRANKAMKICKEEYLKLKTTAVFIQTRFRANKLMASQRESYLKQKNAAMKIQRFHRGYIQMKISRSRFKSVSVAVLVIQRFTKGFLARRQYAPLLTPEAVEERRVKKIQETAATKIQACWRGHHQRSQNGKALNAIRQRLNVHSDAPPEKCLRSRSSKAMEVLSSENITIPRIIAALSDFEYVTRRSDALCNDLGPILPEHLYLMIKSVARSLPEIDICVLSTQILLNLYRYPPTTAMTWFPEHLDSILSIMIHWCDKEELAFPALSTLLWLFAHNAEYKRTILQVPTIEQKLLKMRQLVLRKQNMVLRASNILHTSKFFPIRSAVKPGLKPDWGFDYPDRPRMFTNCVQALDCLSNILKS